MLFCDVESCQDLYWVRDEAIDADAEEDEGDVAVDGLEVQHEDTIAGVLVDDVAEGSEHHEQGDDGDHGRGQNARVLMLVDGFGAHINDDRVSFEDKHGDANVAKKLVSIEHFDLTWHLLIIVQLLAKVAKHHGHSGRGHEDSKDAEVAQEGVCFDPTHWQGWNGQEHDVDI